MTILTGLALIGLGMLLATTLLIWSLFAPRRSPPPPRRAPLGHRWTPRSGGDPFDRFR